MVCCGSPRASGPVALGYPFHPPGRPEKTRIDHFPALASPALILQGTRDPFGTQADVAAYDLGPMVTVDWLQDGNHDLVPRKSSGFHADTHRAYAAGRLAAFAASLLSP